MKASYKALVLTALLTFSATLGAQNLLKTYQEYIELYAPIAVEQQKMHGIPASITLAQGILESGAGTSQLASESNNHFGIKCHNDWTGRKVYSDDDTSNECFRAYDFVSQSYEDHAQFLIGKQRYASLFTLPVTDYKAWAHGLKQAGYATDPNYPNKLIKIIEDYKLYEYDTQKEPLVAIVQNNEKQPVTDTKPEQSHNSKNRRTGTTSAAQRTTIHVSNHHEIYSNNAVRCVVAKPGDTYASIALETGVMEKNIYKFNDLNGDKPLNEGDIVYLAPKRNSSLDTRTYTVKIGDTAWDIAQHYGIRVQALYDINKMDYAEGVRVNQNLKLKK